MDKKQRYIKKGGMDERRRGITENVSMSRLLLVVQTADSIKHKNKIHPNVCHPAFSGQSFEPATLMLTNEKVKVVLMKSHSELM